MGALTVSQRQRLNEIIERRIGLQPVQGGNHLPRDFRQSGDDRVIGLLEGAGMNPRKYPGFKGKARRRGTERDECCTARDHTHLCLLLAFDQRAVITAGAAPMVVAGAGQFLLHIGGDEWQSEQLRMRMF